MSWILGFPFKTSGDITITNEYTDDLDVINVVEDTYNIIEVED